MNPVQVRHIREALDSQFDGLIDVSDIAGKPAQERQAAFRSRALAALAVQIETGCLAEDAASCIIDGRDDQGIDAIAVSGDGKSPHLWLVQAKWHDRGTAGLSQDEVLKFLRGLNKILDSEYQIFNSRFQKLVDQVDGVLGNPKVQVSLIVAVLGDATLHPNVQSIFDDECSKLNAARPFVDTRVLGLKHFHRAIIGDGAEPQIDVEARLEGWSLQREPYEAYYGTMAVPDIAAWYEEYGRGLFAKNIRDSLDLTEVNASITRTLIDEPENFWYFNNGITVLCDSVGKTARYTAIPGGRGEFRLSGASVVNGAQTVAAIHRAMKQKPEAASRGHVLVRFIDLEGCPEGFGDEVTKKTNTQNQVETRDFWALDHDQLSLKEDLSRSLGKVYAIKRGEGNPDPARGCTMPEAAVALACANRSAEFAARAKRDDGLLWERATYRSIFGRHPNAYRVWRTVEILRQVKAELEILTQDLSGRGSAVAMYGDLLVAHIVFRNLDLSQIDSPLADWDSVSGKVPSMTKAALDWLILCIDETYGSGSQVIATCRSAERSEKVVALVLGRMSTGDAPPNLPTSYRADGSRRATAVSVLIDSQFIPVGTVLEFRPRNKSERQALAGWLATDPRRAQATWTNDRSAPLLWAADGHSYSPSGLVTDMIEEATGSRPKAIQGPTRWFWAGRGSLAEMADEARSVDEAS